MADSSQLRAGDDERTATIERLGEHFRAGRITADELEERTDAAQTAVTRGELAKLEADLPKVKRPADLARRAERRRRARREHLTTYVVVIGFLWIIWALTGAGYPWPIWPMLGWGVALVLDFTTGGSGRQLPPGPPMPPLPPGPPRPRRRR